MGTLLVILQLLPSIIATIKAIEVVIPGPGLGEEKRNLILDIIKGVGGDVGELIPAITKVIALVVAMLNKLGIFKTSVPVEL